MLVCSTDYTFSKEEHQPLLLQRAKLNRKKVTFTAAKKARFLRLGQTPHTDAPRSTLRVTRAVCSERGGRAEREPDTALGLSISFKPRSPYGKGFGITTSYIVQTCICSHRYKMHRQESRTKALPARLQGEPRIKEINSREESLIPVTPE